MPSIDDILNNLGAEESSQAEKTAGDNSSAQSEIEKQAKDLGLIGDNAVQKEKTASISNDGGTMNLEDLYNEHFSQEVTKTAGASEDFSEDQDMQKEAQGELAGESFNEELETRLLAHSVKLAMNMGPDSAATKEIQSGPGVIPGAKTQEPQLPVQKNRHGEADDTAIDTSPEYYSLEAKAKDKAKLMKAIEDGKPGEMSHQNVQVDSEMPEGGSQKQASFKLSDLTKAQLDLLHEDFPEDMMKQAFAEVEQEQEKVAELQKTASDCYELGVDFAMRKIAEMEEAQKKKEKEEYKDKEKDKEEDEEEKNASAMGKFICEGYWNTLMEKGAEYYGDENVYVEELIKEAKGGKVMDYLKNLGSKLKSKGSKLKDKAQNMSKGQAAGGAGALGALGGGAAGYGAGKSKNSK